MAAGDQVKQPKTLALSTKVEEDFVGPLTAVRGALEILRDHPDLGDVERLRFVSTALRSCQLLERAVNELADTVYEAAQFASADDAATGSSDDAGGYADRIEIHEPLDIMELDFSGLVFSTSQIVNDVYDEIEHAVRRSGQKWYFLINFENCSVWPEAWVAFAHRGKKIAVNHALGTVRYSPGAETSERGKGRQQQFGSRYDALAYIEELKSGAA